MSVKTRQVKIITYSKRHIGTLLDFPNKCVTRFNKGYLNINKFIYSGNPLNDLLDLNSSPLLSILTK